MFTGIVETLGTVAAVESRGGDLRLAIAAGGLDLEAVRLGDSIAVNGICLTVVAVDGDRFAADVSVETLDHTTAGSWVPGTRVNLEQALTAQQRLGGHIVSGHVDGVGEVLERHGDARSERLRLRAPLALARYIAPKGSIAVDGTSLTVNAVEGTDFEVNIVPHTLTHTIIGDYRAGSQVNLEVDVVARYLERLLWGAREGHPGAPPALGSERG